MPNPFEAPKVETLRLAFPSIDAEIIDTVLHNFDGEMDATFEALLAMSDPSLTKPSPTTSSRPEASYTVASQTSPFAQYDEQPQHKPKPTLSVREDLAQWRQQLARESERRAISARGRPTSLKSNHNNPFVSRSGTHGARLQASINGAPSSSRPLTASNFSFNRRSTSDAIIFARNLNTLPEQSARSGPVSNRERPGLPPRRSTAAATTITGDAVSWQDHHTNPFETHSDNAYFHVPPPSYEAHEQDTLIDPAYIQR